MPAEVIHDLSTGQRVANDVPRIVALGRAVLGMPPDIAVDPSTGKEHIPAPRRTARQVGVAVSQQAEHVADGPRPPVGGAVRPAHREPELGFDAHQMFSDIVAHLVHLHSARARPTPADRRHVVDRGVCELLTGGLDVVLQVGLTLAVGEQIVLDLPAGSHHSRYGASNLVQGFALAVIVVPAATGPGVVVSHSLSCCHSVLPPFVFVFLGILLVLLPYSPT